MLSLILPPRLKARIEAEAVAAFPRECCGLIEGIRTDKGAEALALHPAPNVAAAADRFEIAPEVHFQALKAARQAGHVLIGCYHSPSRRACGRRPSSRDLAGAGEENFLWLIAALAAAEGPVTLAAFVYSAGGFSPTGWMTGADLVTSSL